MFGSLSWSNAPKVETDDEMGQQARHMEECHLEDAGLVLTCDMDTWESEIRSEIITAFVDHAAKSWQRWREWVTSALERGAKKTHALSRTPSPNPVDRIHDVQEASLANSATLE